MLRVAVIALALFAGAFALGQSGDLDALNRPSANALRAFLAAIRDCGSRTPGALGEAKALDLAENRLRALGAKVTREPFAVTIPDERARGEIASGSWSSELYPLWPNLVRTSTCDVSGTLLAGGDGSLASLAGKEVRGRIVVLDFRSGKHWTEAAMLGAAAIVFVAKGEFARAEAEAKFASTPLDVPRFLVRGTAADTLMNLARTGAPARLRCRQDWAIRQSANLVADFAGTDGSDPRPIMLWAYADSMSVAPGAAPGAEQACGLTALLELARVLADSPHRRPVRFVVSGAHALGLQGAREYIERRFQSPERPPLLVATLDLSSGSKSLGVFGRGYAYNYRDEILESVLPLCRVLRRHAEALTRLLNESSPRVVLTDAANHSDNRTWRNNIPAQFAFDCEPFMSAGYAAVTFATIDDARTRVDTPGDSFDRVDVDALHRQVRVLSALIAHLVNDPIAQTGDDAIPLPESHPNRITRIGGFATATGYVAIYDPKKSLVPDVRVGGSLAVRITNRKTMMGVRGNEAQSTTPGSAEYRFIGLPPLTDYATLVKPDTVLRAYHLDAGSGRIDAAPDEGPFGSDAFPTTTSLKTSFRSSPIVLFPCVARNVFGLDDPQELTPLADATFLDPVGAGRPLNYGISRSAFDASTPLDVVDSGVIFWRQKQRYQILMASASGEQRLILRGVDGVGYASDEFPSDVTIAAARDLCALNQSRVDELAKHRVLPFEVFDVHREAESELAEAMRAETALDWPEARRHGRASWALALRAYPILKNTASDIVNGVIFYSFLLIPFSFFVERLLFNRRKLTQQVLVATAIFTGGFLALRALHPAFDIVANPAMIFVGFVMGALSLVVMAFVVGKFESALRSVKQARSGVREIDVRRANVATAAFSLGISNLRRRKARTFLTIVTLAVMTFIVLSFTSIVPQIQLMRSATGNAARYSGILLRLPSFDPLDADAFGALANEFQGNGTVVRRVFSFGADVLSGPAMSMRHGNVWADASALEGFDPGEASVTRPQDALLDGRWFLPKEGTATILPKPMADQLQARIGDRVDFMGLKLQVVGIVDPERMRSIVDLDGEDLLPPDFSLSRQQQTQSRTQARAFRKFVRLDPAVCFFVPADTALALNGSVRSLAVAFSRPETASDAMASLMPRLRLNLYGAVPNGNRLEVSQFSVQQGSRSSGLPLILLQLAIAGLFVLNTMIAGVYERTREISIFSAIGLAPNHIATLFFAESLVLCVVSVMLGYFAAQIVARFVLATGALPQLALNFSSSSAILSALLIVALVVASTIYPARKAAQIAAPAMAESALESEPEGDEWSVPLPFSVSEADARPVAQFLADWLRAYERYSIGAFVTEGTTLSTADDVSVQAKVWLAPYDLGVCQQASIDARQTDVPEVWEMNLRLTRLTGEPSNWKKLNPRFLAAIRREFLLWRTLTDEERARFLT